MLWDISYFMFFWWKQNICNIQPKTGRHRLDEETGTGGREGARIEKATHVEQKSSLELDLWAPTPGYPCYKGLLLMLVMLL